MDVKERIEIVRDEIGSIRRRLEELKQEYRSKWNLINHVVKPNGFTRTWMIPAGEKEKYEYKNRILFVQYKALNEELDCLDRELAP